MLKKTNIIMGCAILFIVALDSCAVTQKYERPEMQTQNLYRTDHLEDSVFLQTDTSSFASISWKSFFSDTLLKNYIATALNRNIDMQIALQSIRAAAAIVKQGRAEMRPSVSAELDYNRTKNSTNTRLGQQNNEAYNTFDLDANLSWEADIWGKIRSRERANQAAYLQSVEAQRAIKTRLISNVATTYYQLMMLDAQKKVARESIKARDSSLQTTIALKESGRVTAAAVKQTEAQVYEAQLILIGLRRQERTLENAFCLLLNEPSHAIHRSVLEDQHVKTPLKIGAPSDLLVNRPDVREAEYELMQAFELTNVAKSHFYPSLIITASGGFQSAELKNWFSLNSLFGSIGGSLLEPILNHRQIKTQYEIAQTQQQQALLNYQEILLNAGNEVSDALFDFQTQNESIILEEKQFQAYQVAVIYSQQLLINGLANYLEVLTARQNVLSTQLNLVNARFERLASIVRLYEALGGGIQ